MRDLFQDIRYALRTLGKNPGFTLIAVLTLALGIGANTAIFSLLDSILLRSLPVPHPEQLVVLTDPDRHGHDFGSQGGDRSLLAYSEFQYLRDHSDSFSEIFAADSDLADLQASISDPLASNSSNEEKIRARLVSAGYFQALGITPVIGRGFSPDMDRAPGGAPFAVISYAFWTRRFALDPNVLGRTIRIHDVAFQIIGVGPRGFSGETVGDIPDIWIPITMQAAIYPGTDLLSPATGIVNQHIWLQVIARLKPGVTVEQAKAKTNLVFQQRMESVFGASLSAEDRRNYSNQRINLQPGARGASVLRESFGEPLKVLMGLVGLILLIACVNVANLLLARGAARQKELSVRLAIGAGRFRLIRQLLAESLVLALLGAVAGIFLAQWVDALLLGLAGGDSSSIQLNVHSDLRILSFTLVVTFLTAILFGLIPALRATRVDLISGLKSAASGASAATSHRRMPTAKLLVVAQVAVSLVLLVAAGLFVRSLAKLSEVELGYDRENLLLFRVDTDPGGYKGVPAITRVHEELLEKFRAIPGVRSVTLSGNGLFSHSESGDPIEVEGYVPKSGEEMHSRYDHAGPNYFSTVGIPILLGREIGPQDSSGPRVGVINQTFAKLYFPNTNPLGKRVRDTYPGNPTDMQIVGVVADAKYNSLRETTPPRIYAPFFNPLWEQTDAVYELRTTSDPATVGSAIRAAIRETNRSIPEVEINTMSVLVDNSIQTERFIAQLSAAFGVLAILLASIGLYGVMAYTVSRRTRDIGIHLALGAQPSRVLWTTLRETLVLMLIGALVGIPIAMAASYLIRSMLFGVKFADPLAMLAAVVLLALVAAAAGLLPARRAASVDPMVALRYD